MMYNQFDQEQAEQVQQFFSPQLTLGGQIFSPIDRLAQKHGLPPKELKAFFDTTIETNAFNYRPLMDMLDPIFKKTPQSQVQQARLMLDLIALMKKMRGRGRAEIEGLTDQETELYYSKIEAQISPQIGVLAEKHSLPPKKLKAYLDRVLQSNDFDWGSLADLLESYYPYWKDRNIAEARLMLDLLPLIKKLARGREISGLTDEKTEDNFKETVARQNSITF